MTYQQRAFLEVRIRCNDSLRANIRGLWALGDTKQQSFHCPIGFSKEKMNGQLLGRSGTARTNLRWCDWSLPDSPVSIFPTIHNPSDSHFVSQRSSCETSFRRFRAEQPAPRLSRSSALLDDAQKLSKASWRPGRRVLRGLYRSNPAHWGNRD